MNLDSSLDSLKGIGAKTKELFDKAGITSLGRLLACYYPRAYEQYQPPQPICGLREGDLLTVSGCLSSPVSNRYIRGNCISSAVCTDGSGSLLLSWYHMPYIKNSVRTGIVYLFRGRIRKKGQRLLMEQPAVFSADQYEALMQTLQPVYSLTKGMTVRMIQKAVRQVLDQGDLLQEYLPPAFLKQYDLCDYAFAVQQMHFPEDSIRLQTARRRLVFDEFFFFLLQLQLLRQQREKSKNSFSIQPSSCVRQVLEALPYQLTGAQQRVWAQLAQELQSDTVMARLIQGDVGSGKTIISILALLMVAESGYQGALMAPTEVLARQHYDSVTALLHGNGLPFEAVLLTGSMTQAQKREVYAKMASGEASIIIGTHALIQEKAVYHSLALVITDEQHRFGVRQRELLAEKGTAVHTLVMSATPIPRTLAVILYGDLDISVINEMPANRLPIKNCVVGVPYRPKAYEFIKNQVSQGHQAYIICPMVEESEAVDAENVIEYTERLRSVLPGGMRIECLHGRMRPAEKNEIMEAFLQNQIQVLVSTTVVEVGVNVPNATVMMIENAERFGLAQLHQLRGRVGRGSAQSYCIFLHGTDSRPIRERLDILNRSNDGFEIANCDLKLRGPGDLFGVRQSGMMDFQLADIYADAEILALANEAVSTLLAEDPELEFTQNSVLKRHYEHILRQESEHLSL